MYFYVLPGATFGSRRRWGQRLILPGDKMSKDTNIKVIFRSVCGRRQSRLYYTKNFKRTHKLYTYLLGVVIQVRVTRASPCELMAQINKYSNIYFAIHCYCVSNVYYENIISFNSSAKYDLRQFVFLTTALLGNKNRFCFSAVQIK